MHDLPEAGGVEWVLSDHGQSFMILQHSLLKLPDHFENKQKKQIQEMGLFTRQ
jgi:hypothetical protein